MHPTASVTDRHLGIHGSVLSPGVFVQRVPLAVVGIMIGVLAIGLGTLLFVGSYL